MRNPSIEPRALNLFVKPEKRKQFEREFRREFGDQFLLCTREEFLMRKLFGTGKEYPSFRGMLGDYLAIAVDQLTIFTTGEDANYNAGVHAGLAEDEMIVPLIIVEKMS